MPRRSLLEMIGDEATSAVFLSARIQPRKTFALSFLGFTLEFSQDKKNTLHAAKVAFLAVQT